MTAVGGKAQKTSPIWKNLADLRGEFEIGQANNEVFLDIKQIIWYWCFTSIQYIDVRLVGTGKIKFL